MLCALGYFYVFPYQSSINNPNENVRLYMTAALVEDGTYAINRQRQQWGWVNDCACTVADPSTGELRPCTNPRNPAEETYYSVKAPGTSFLGLLPYAAYFHLTDPEPSRAIDPTALFVCRVFGSIVPWLIFLFFFHRFLGRHTPNLLVRDAVFVSVALGSCLYGYGMLFMSHTLSGAAAFASFMLLYDARCASRKTFVRSALAGFFAASVSLLEYPGFVASVALSLYALFALRSIKHLVGFGLGASLPTAAMMHFQASCFGSPFSPGHLFVESQVFREQHEEGFFGAVGFQWDAVYGLLFHPGAGLFPLTPILVFGVVGLALLLWRKKERIEGVTVVGLIVLTVVAIAFMNNWRGGWTIGPRYLALLYPFLGWATLIGLKPWVRRAPRLASAFAVGATAAGLMLSGVPSAYYPHYPPEVDRPLSQIVVVLVEHDYAPHTLLSLLHVYGTLSMLPWLILALASLVWITRAEAYPKDPGAILLGGALVALLITVPLALDPRPGNDQVEDAVALITAGWDPAGHDRAARLESDLGYEEQPEGYRELAAVYEAEGRERDAARARNRAEALERRRR